MRRVLEYIPFYRDIPVARESWLRQKAPDTWVDVLIMRFDPLPDAGAYPNLAIKNELARRMCITGDYDYLFIVEDDIVLPDDALEKLLTVNNPVVVGLHHGRPETWGICGLCVRIADPDGPQDADDRYLELKDVKNWGDIIECTSSSQACMLLSKKLLPLLEGVMGKDYEISRRLSTLSIPLLCHTGVLCGHVDETGEIIGVKTHGNLPPYRSFDCSP